MKRGFLGLLVLVLACVATPVRADSTYGSVSAADGVLYDDCRGYAYAYAVHDIPSEANFWDLDVALYGPDDVRADTDFVGPGGLTGASAFSLCTQVNPYGAYTIRTTFEWKDGADTWHYSQLDDAHFTLRKPFSRTSMSVSTRRPAYGQVVRYRVAAYDERPAGYVRRAFAWVHLEKRKDGRWVRIKGGRAVTHDTGRVVIRLRYGFDHKHVLVRAVTEKTTRYSRSTSPVVRLW